MNVIGIFELVILMCALCGVIMVIGSLLLIYKGIIRLKEASCDNSISVELMNQIKISTRYPALAFFVCGFVFLFTAIWFSKDNQRWSVSGRFIAQEALPAASKLVIEPHCESPEHINVDTDGKFSKSFISDHKGDFMATLNAAGYVPTEITLTKGFLGSLKFDNQSGYNIKKPANTIHIEADTEHLVENPEQVGTTKNDLEIFNSYTMTPNGGINNEKM